jgi:hypothetical protein
MESLNDTVRLRALGFRPRVINVLDVEIELVFVALGIAAVFGASVGQDAEQLDALLHQRMEGRGHSRDQPQ